MAWGASGRRRGKHQPKKTVSNASLLGRPNAPRSTGVRVKSQTVFSRGLTAESAGELVERHTRCFCHTGLEKTRGKHTSKTKSPRGSSWAREQTTETPSTEATPANHRGCFNARPPERLAGPRSGTHGGVLGGASRHPPTTSNRKATHPLTRHTGDTRCPRGADGRGVPPSTNHAQPKGDQRPTSSSPTMIGDPRSGDRGRNLTYIAPRRGGFQTRPGPYDETPSCSSPRATQVQPNAKELFKGLPWERMKVGELSSEVVEGAADHHFCADRQAGLVEVELGVVVRF